MSNPMCASATIEFEREKKYHFGDEKKTYQGSFSLVLEIV